MIKSCANKITSFLVYNQIINKDEYEVYSYGFEVLMAFIVNIMVILTIGYILNIFYETILFLIIYCPIRQFAGGYHADNYKRCLLVFILIYLSNIFILNILINNELYYICIILTLISYTGICIISPLEHRQNPLSVTEKKIYRKKVICSTGMVLILSIIGIKYNIKSEYSMYMLSSIICIFIMQILGLVKQSKGVKI